MGKNIFPYTLWCYKICRENIFFRLEEAHSSERKLVLIQKLIILLLRELFDTYEDTEWETYIYILKLINLECHEVKNTFCQAIPTIY